MDQSVNMITLRGTLDTVPVFSHENHGKRFFRFHLMIPRLSGTLDILPVIASETLLNQIDLSGGEMLRVCGQVRSHNIRENQIRHLMIFVFATEITAEDGDPVNEVTVSGPLCREPVYRRTPLGREICDIMLAVPRVFHRADYLPCILWGRIAQEASICHVRDRMQIVGRLQSRTYTKRTEEGPVERVAYEISALTADILEQEMQEST